MIDNKKGTEEFAKRLNKNNKEHNVFYVCAPEDIGDWIQFQIDLLKQTKDQFANVKMRQDRNDKYRIYKMKKIYDKEGNLISLDWDSSYRGY